VANKSRLDEILSEVGWRFLPLCQCVHGQQAQQQGKRPEEIGCVETGAGYWTG